MLDTVAPYPFSLQDSTFLVVGDGQERDYSGTVSHVLFLPQASQFPQTTIDGQVIWHMGQVTWSLTIEYPQDWGQASALGLFLMLHAGQRRQVLFTPSSSLATQRVRADVLLAPGPIGGTAGQIAAGAVTMGVFDAPVLEEI